jgi:hypothetical protein
MMDFSPYFYPVGFGGVLVTMSLTYPQHLQSKPLSSTEGSTPVAQKVGGAVWHVRTSRVYRVYRTATSYGSGPQASGIYLYRIPAFHPRLSKILLFTHSHHILS